MISRRSPNASNAVPDANQRPQKRLRSLRESLDRGWLAHVVEKEQSTCKLCIQSASDRVRSVR